MRWTVALALTLLLPLTARADERLSGTLQAEPLGVFGRANGRNVTWRIANEDPLVERVRLVAGEQRAVTVRARATGQGSIHLLAIDGRTTSPTDVFDSPELAGRPVSRLPEDAAITIHAAVVQTGKGGKQFPWYRVTAGPVAGWIPGTLATIGAQSPIGRLLGRIAAPFFGTISALRNARTFHPDGTTYKGIVRSLAPPAPFADPARRLEGDALARVGAGTWKTGMPGGLADVLPDALSIAVRFRERGAPVSVEVQPTDQHLLTTAYLDRLRHLPAIVFKGDKLDYFDNVYFAGEPFLIGPDLKAWVRIVPAGKPALSDPALAQPRDGAARERKLAVAAKEGKAVFRIEVQKVDPSFSKEWLGVDVKKWWAQGWSAARKQEPWVALAELRFDAEVKLDQEALRFSPDLAGRGFVPNGVVAGIRPAVYRASADARAGSEEERKRRESTGLIERLRGR